MADEPVDPAEVRHALRSLRPMMYRVENTGRGCTLALVMNASEAGRANAAGKIVRLLAEHGFALDTAAPADALTMQADGFTVIRDGG